MDNEENLSSQTSSSSLGSRSLTVASLTGASRVLGLVRDVVLSSFFGASPVADAFFVAFRIPNFFRRLLAEGAFAQAFVPVLADYQESKTREEVELFIRTIAGNFGVVLLSLCIVGVLVAPFLVTVFTMGAWHSEERQETASGLLRIMFSYLGLISYTAFAGAILNSFHRFAVPALTPVLLNVALIAGALVGSQYLDQPVYALAWAVVLAGIVQFGFHMPSLASLKLLKLPRINWRSEGTRRMLKLLGPAVYAASAGQINILVGTILASQLVVGSVSWLYYADRLIELPVGMIAIAIQTVILPNLSRLYQRDDTIGFRSSLSWGVHVGIMLGLPASVGLCFLSTPLITTIFFHGEFGTRDAEMVALALQAFSLGVLPLMLVRIAAPGFFARQDTTTPFKFASISVGTNILVSLALFRFLGHLGIAIATTVAAYVHCFLLVRRLGVQRDLAFDRELAIVSLRTAAACIVMLAVLVWFSPSNEEWLTTGVWTRVGWLSLLMSGGIGTYFLTLAILGVRLHHFKGHK